MKTFEELTIDELIDYCILIRETREAKLISDGFPALKQAIDERINSIKDDEEKEFYKCILNDIIIEIESNSYYGDYELIKDKIIDNEIKNIDIVSKKLEKSLKGNSQSLEAIKASFLVDNKYCIKYAEDEFSVYNASLRAFNELKAVLDIDSHFNNLAFARSEPALSFGKYTDYIELRTIGKFQELDPNGYLEMSACANIDYIFESVCSRLWHSNDKHKYLKRNNKYSSLITCFRILDTVMPFSVHMSYFKINKKKYLPNSRRLLGKKTIHEIYSRDRKSIYDDNKIEKVGSIVWFMLDLPNNFNDFNYSDIYKNENINQRNITWFKLMDNYHTNYQNKIAYYRIDIDGSVTKEEVAYFDISGERIQENNCFDESVPNVVDESTTLHYFVAGDDVDVTNGIPMVIGYSECDSSPYVK